MLSSVAADGKDGDGLKRVKVESSFSSVNAIPVQFTKILLWLVLHGEIFLIYLLYISNGEFSIRLIKAKKTDFSTE